MKKITLFLLSFFTIQIVCAQSLRATLSMNPRPIANLNEWANRRDILTLVAFGSPLVALPAYIKINTTIKTTGGATVAVTDMLRAPQKTFIRGANNIYYAGDVINMQSLVFESSYQKKINSTGKLPAGSYQIIVRLDSTSLPIAFSNTETKVFFLAGTQLPLLIAPANDAVLNSAAAQTAITFRWTALVPKPAEAVRYRLQVFEVLANQTAMQALRSNQPLLDKEVLNSTQYIWQPQLSFVDSTHNKFVWTIQSYDFQRQLITGETANGEGRSEAKTFRIEATKKIL